jgi:N,N-dimethylformamidase beta subunit-like protein/fibronectin type III domain protein
LLGGTNTGLTVCNWSGPSFTVPTSWTSGIYLGVLTNAAGYQNYIPFTVRDDSRQAALLYVEPVTTYEAYNNWPDVGTSTSNGKSLYDNSSGGTDTVAGTGHPRAVMVSFDRPYKDTGATELTDANGWSWEEYFIQWSEQAGYDISYATDTDVDQNPSMLQNYRGVVFAGHSEYWSKAMFDGAEAARDAGVNLGFIGGNDVYWQVRFQPSGTNVPDRVVVSYKNTPNNTFTTNDPIGTPSLQSVRFQDPPVNRPGQLLTGESFLGSTDRSTLNTDLIVSDDQAWPYLSVGLSAGNNVSGIVGYETDAFNCQYAAPANSYYTILASSPFTDSTPYTNYAQSSLYQAPSGAWVFDAGTMSWPWALARPGWVDSRIQQVTGNLLNAFSGGGSPTVAGTHVPQCSTQRQTTFEGGTLTGPRIPATPTGADRALGTVSLETVNPLNGSYSARIPNTATSYLDELLTATDDTSLTFSMKLNALPSGDARVAMFTTVYNTVGNLVVRSSGVLCLRNGVNWIGGSTATACTKTPLTAGATYSVMMREIRGSGADGVLEAWVAPTGAQFGAPFAKTAAGTWALRVDKLDFGATTGVALDAVFDDVNVNGQPWAPPTVPTGLAATPKSSTSVQLTWNDTPDETGYVLERDTSASFASAMQVTLAGDTTTYTDTNLNQATTYYYRVHTVGEGGSSAPGNVVTVGTPQTPPAAPSNLQATFPSSTQAQLTWTVNSTNETSIVVERSGTSAFSSVTSVSLPPGSNSYLDVVTAEGPYYYRVKAVNSGGSSAYSSVVQNSRIKDVTFEDGTTNLINPNSGVDKNPGNLVVQDASTPLKGGYSAHASVSGAWLEQDFSNTNNLYVSFYLRVNALPSADMRVAQILNGNSTYMANLWVRANGLLCLKNGAYWNGGTTTTACTTSALVVGTVYRIGLHEQAGNGTSNALLEGFYANPSSGSLTRFTTWTLTPSTGGYFTLPGNALRFGATLSAIFDATFDDVKLDTMFMPSASP